MPIFSRSSFRTPRKPVRRKGGSLPNISQLDDTAFSVDSLRLDGGPVTMKLGGHEFIFEDGQWIIGSSHPHNISEKTAHEPETEVFLIRAHHILPPSQAELRNRLGWDRENTVSCRNSTSRC